MASRLFPNQTKELFLLNQKVESIIGLMNGLSERPIISYETHHRIFICRLFQRLFRADFAFEFSQLSHLSDQAWSLGSDNYDYLIGEDDYDFWHQLLIKIKHPENENEKRILILITKKIFASKVDKKNRHKYLATLTQAQIAQLPWTNIQKKCLSFLLFTEIHIHIIPNDCRTWLLL